MARESVPATRGLQTPVAELGTTRKEFIRNVGAAALGATLAAQIPGTAEATAKRRRRRPRGMPNTPANGRPNILLCVVDDESIETLDEMNRVNTFFNSGGVNLTEGAYGDCALCAPSRTSLLTGEYPHNHGTFDNERGYINYRDNNFANDDLLARMDRNGYRVGFFGKFMNGYQTSPAYPSGSLWSHPHADRWCAITGGQNDAMAGGWQANNDGVVTDEKGDHTTYFGPRAEQFIRNGATQDSPWLCVFTPTDPHSPYRPAPIDEHKYDGAVLNTPSTRETDFSDKSNYWRQQTKYGPAEHQQVYEGQLEEGAQNDRWFGYLIDALRQTGQLDNTVVIYVGDNGYMIGEHGGLSQKLLPYEQSIRVPLLIRGPGMPTRASVNAVWGSQAPLVSRVDLTTTILCAAGLPGYSGTEGRNLANLVNGPGPWRKRVFAEQPGDNTPAMGWALVREGDKKLIRLYRTDEYELYRLNVDRAENESLAKNPNFAGDIDRLMPYIARFKGSSGDAVRAAEI